MVGISHHHHHQHHAASSFALISSSFASFPVEITAFRSSWAPWTWPLPALLEEPGTGRWGSFLGSHSRAEVGPCHRQKGEQNESPFSDILTPTPPLPQGTHLHAFVYGFRNKSTLITSCLWEVVSVHGKRPNGPEVHKMIKIHFLPTTLMCPGSGKSATNNVYYSRKKKNLEHLQIYASDFNTVE